MPVPTEIDLLSTRVDSYRHPIDSQTTTFRHPKILVLTPSCNRRRLSPADLLSTGVDSYRHGSTGLTELKKEILNGLGRHFLATIRLDLANDLSSGKSPPWPSVGMRFGEDHFQTGGQFYLNIYS